MREIDGLEIAVKTLEPHMKEINEHFERENERFKGFLRIDHNPMGRILKCHLIIEHYMELYFTHKIGLENLNDARLGFYNKAKLLPNHGSASVVKSGILAINGIRNSFAHNIERMDQPIPEQKMQTVNDFVSIARPNKV